MMTDELDHENVSDCPTEAVAGRLGSCARR
jgi:hypothetical protein